MVFFVKSEVAADGQPHADLDVPFDGFSIVHRQDDVVGNTLTFQGLLYFGSNPGSADLQDLTVDGPEGVRPLYSHLARSAASWNDKSNVGLVMGATNSEQLAEVRRICPDMPLLIPGVGAQGGDLEEAVRLGTDERGRRALINSSRGIIYASSGPDFAQGAAREAASLRDSINRILEAEGKGWH